MAIDSSSISQKFIGHINHLEKSRTKIELLYSKGTIVLRDMEQVYKGLFLDFYTSFENFIEELFIRLIVDDSIHKSRRVKSKVSVNSQEGARSIVLQKKKYIDWLPYKNTKELSVFFLNNGLPFCGLENDEYTTLSELAILRNVIAHKSRHSVNKFNTTFIENRPLNQNEKSVIGYLRGIYRRYPTQNRYEYYMIEVAQITHKLCNL